MIMRRLVLLVILVFLPLIYFSPHHAKAFDLFASCSTVTLPDGSQQQECGPCKANPQAPSCTQASAQGTTDPIAGPNGIINKAATIIALVAGVGAVIMVILGGLNYVTSGGNTESTTKARQRILSALIGLVIIALAWAIVRFVTDNVLQ